MQNKSGKILVVDDNPDILQSLRQLLKFDFESIDTIEKPDKLPEMIRKGDYDVIVLDMNFKAGARTGREGLDWTRAIVRINPDAVVVLITAYADIELAVEAMKTGGTDFVVKPWEPQKLISTLKAAVKLSKSKQEVNALKSQQKMLRDELDMQFDPLIYHSVKMTELIRVIDKVAGTDANILITGEHGTGKELVAREIHKKSLRSDNIFVKVDLGTITDSLFESELFGHIMGSFTDAKSDKTGRFEMANHGTLFLDEVTNLAPHLQTRLLSVLQNRTMVKVGSIKEIPIDIRLISATNVDISEIVRSGAFREDLLYRINTIRIHVPPLRERKGDIETLINHFFESFRQKYRKPTIKMDPRLIEIYEKHNWPGNVRELKHTVEKAVILSEGGYVRDSFINEQMTEDKPAASTDTLSLYDLEKETINRALKLANNNLSQAAKMLEISRTTLYSKIQKHGI
nr:sigma-54-dependent Fis family transcriptional regulator [Bacteroidota bacterium]